MAENNTKKPRMYDPWGYQDENNYQSSEIIMENDLDSFFVDAAYNKDDNKIHFTNKDGEELVTIDVSEFDKSDKIIEKAWYEDGKIYILFTNGDLVTIDVEELIDENEFNGGLQVNDGVVSILIDPTTEPYVTTSDDGLKVSGIDSAIEVAVEAEKNRAESAETALDEKIEAETARAEGVETALDEKIEAETSRSESAETALDEKIEAETTRAEGAEAALDEKIEAEISRSMSAETALDAKITQEISDREADVDAEEARATSAETALDERIDGIISGDTPIKQLDELLEKLGYKDNDTLVINNPNEVAFGKYNVSNTSEDASGQTIFSIGNGKSDENRSNALEVRADGTVLMWVEGDFMAVNDLLGMLAHETY